MSLWGQIQKVEPQSDGTIKVFGIASTESEDSDGEIVRSAAMRAAIPDYMKFPALREMHGLSAAGTTLEIGVGDDGVTRIVGHIVDPTAILKIRNQVYRGFSIGGRVTQRDTSNPKIVTGVVLNEISLVDRPANPEAIFDCWKAGTAEKEKVEMRDETVMAMARDLERLQGPDWQKRKEDDERRRSGASDADYARYRALWGKSHAEGLARVQAELRPSDPDPGVNRALVQHAATRAFLRFIGGGR